MDEPTGMVMADRLELNTIPVALSTTMPAWGLKREHEMEREGEIEEERWRENGM